MTTRTADRIREQLEQAIIAGEFADGERLDEVRLSARFSASRTPVREALHALSASGLAEQLPRRGVFVRYPSLVELIEMFEVMAEMEAMCGRLAARRISGEALLKLEEAARTCAATVETGDTDLYYRENERFHTLLYEASGNAFLATRASRLHRRLQAFRRLQLKVRGRMHQSMQEHAAILEAVRAGDGEKAATALRAHIMVQGEKLNDLLASYTQQLPSRSGHAERLLKK